MYYLMLYNESNAALLGYCETLHPLRFLYVGVKDFTISLAVIVVIEDVGVTRIKDPFAPPSQRV